MRSNATVAVTAVTIRNAHGDVLALSQITETVEKWHLSSFLRYQRRQEHPRLEEIQYNTGLPIGYNIIFDAS
jgi:hypothetical protein